MLEDHGGALWVGTFDGGLNRMDRDGRVVQSLPSRPAASRSLGSDDVRALLEDQARAIFGWVRPTAWICSIARPARSPTIITTTSDAESLRDSYRDVPVRGCDRSRLDRHATPAASAAGIPAAGNSAAVGRAGSADKLVTAFADAPNGKVWIASLGGGLVRFDGDTGEATDLDTIIGRRNALGDRRVMSLHQDRARDAVDRHHGGRPCASSTADGQARVDRRQAGRSAQPERRRHHDDFRGARRSDLDRHSRRRRQRARSRDRADPPAALRLAAAGAVSAPNVSAIAEDSSGNFWIGTDGGGLDLARAGRHGRSRSFATIRTIRPACPSNTVYALAVDARGSASGSEPTAADSRW